VLKQEDAKNLLLRRMAEADFDRLAPHLEPVKCGKGERLFGRFTPIEHVWFMERGLGSLVIVSPEGQQVEAGLFGRDGFTPTSLVHGSDQSPYDCIIQLPDEAYRLPVSVLREAMADSPALRDLLLRYVETLALQTSYTALSNAVHLIDERLARWLLMCHDRAEGDELPLTHGFLSIMLAVRRPSVTTSLHVLEGNGFIRAERGWITIRDRAALEEFAGDAYGVPEREYERLLGPLR
jgi:CRP-like cAMP-binding protein